MTKPRHDNDVELATMQNDRPISTAHDVADEIIEMVPLSLPLPSPSLFPTFPVLKLKRPSSSVVVVVVYLRKAATRATRVLLDKFSSPSLTHSRLNLNSL